MPKTGQAAHCQVRSSGQGRGLDGHRKVPQWYLRMSGATAHQLRIDAMKPYTAASNHGVPDNADKWRETLARLPALDTKNPLPEAYQLASLRRMRAGDVNRIH